MRSSNERGTTSMGEYALLIFLVVGTIIAMTTYVKRGFQARMHDARHYMITTASEACNKACMNATWMNGENRIGEQYEPYYAFVDAEVKSGILNVKQMTDKVASKVSVRAKTHVNSESNQSPPKYAATDQIMRY